MVVGCLVVGLLVVGVAVVGDLVVGAFVEPPVGALVLGAGVLEEQSGRALLPR